MSDAYRTPGRDIDATAVETAKIHEAGETKRASNEEREKTRRAAIANRDTGGYVVTRIAACCVFIGIIIAVGVTANTYVESRSKPGSCHDESYSKEYRSSLVCSHPLHVYIESDKERACRCGVPKLPQ